MAVITPCFDINVGYHQNCLASLLVSTIDIHRFPCLSPACLMLVPLSHPLEVHPITAFLVTESTDPPSRPPHSQSGGTLPTRIDLSSKEKHFCFCDLLPFGFELLAGQQRTISANELRCISICLIGIFVRQSPSLGFVAEAWAAPRSIPTGRAMQFGVEIALGAINYAMLHVRSSAAGRIRLLGLTALFDKLILVHDLAKHKAVLHLHNISGSCMSSRLFLIRHRSS